MADGPVVVEIRVRCDAVLHEAWTVEVTAEQAAQLAEDPDVGVVLLDLGRVLYVANEGADSERDRTVEGWRRLPPAEAKRARRTSHA